MSVYLIKTTEQYRCDSQAEATRLINEAKENKLESNSSKTRK